MKYKALKGMNDIYFKESDKFEYILKVAREVFANMDIQEF